MQVFEIIIPNFILTLATDYITDKTNKSSNKFKNCLRNNSGRLKNITQEQQ